MNVGTLYVMVGEPDTAAATECPDCGFDAVLTFPLSILSDEGVGPLGTYVACVRCADMAEDE